MTQLPQETPSRTPAGAPPEKSHPARLVIIALIVLLVGGGLSVTRRLAERKALAGETEKLAVPVVSVIKPASEPSSDQMVLPAQLQPYVESWIYSRTNGYLLHWYKDMGSHVKKGELLADIDTPEVDQELSQAKAARQQIQAQLELARSSAERWTNLRKTDSVSQQEADQETSAYRQAQANLAAADANVRRLEQLESFKHIYAPFSGVITRRNVDIGTLINAGNGGATQQLFFLAQTDPIRVYVNVPESAAPSIRPGLAAYLELTQFPGRKFQGQVVRTAEAIDPGTRTLLTEVDVPNKSSELLPGGYAQVHLNVQIGGTRVQVPVNALLFRSEGLRAVVIDQNHKTRLQALTIGRDFGTSLEVLQGLTPNDWIVINPPDSLEDNQQVNVKEASIKIPVAPTGAPGAKTPTPQSGGPSSPGGGGAANPPKGPSK